MIAVANAAQKRLTASGLLLSHAQSRPAVQARPYPTGGVF
jgi:hypothetical protein